MSQENIHKKSNIRKISVPSNCGNVFHNRSYVTIVLGFPDRGLNSLQFNNNTLYHWSSERKLCRKGTLRPWDRSWNLNPGWGGQKHTEKREPGMVPRPWKMYHGLILFRREPHWSYCPYCWGPSFRIEPWVTWPVTIRIVVYYEEIVIKK